jgi:aconitase B
LLENRIPAGKLTKLLMLKAAFYCDLGRNIITTIVLPKKAVEILGTMQGGQPFSHWLPHQMTRK